MCTPPKSFLLVSAESSRRCMFSVPDTKAQANTVVVLYRVWCFSDFESSCLVMYPLVEILLVFRRDIRRCSW